MDNDKVLAYMSQVDNDYELLRRSAAEQFERMWEKGNPTNAHVENYAAWRKHHASWKAWYWSVKDDLWLSADDYNTAREWHRQLDDWRERLGKFAESVPSTPVPDRENTTTDDIRETAGAAAAPLALVAGAALIGFLILKGKR